MVVTVGQFTLYDLRVAVSTWTFGSEMVCWGALLTDYHWDRFHLLLSITPSRAPVCN